MQRYIDIHPKIEDAIKNNKPVVALESTIISHGMPFPKNMETALEVKDIVASNGATPATIAIMNGKIKIGLTKEEIKYLSYEGNKIKKASRRDIPFLISKKIPGATTVSSTMFASQMAGIKIFATGGIGGVHRDAPTSFDISADLQELARTNVAVVCAGIKSILDLNLTLEYLETHGVPVLGYKTSELPAFYTQKSGLQVDYQLDTPEEIADLLYSKWKMKLNGGVVVTNPIPKSKQLDHQYMSKIIDKAIFEAKQLEIKGKEITPFLLKKVKDLTKGKSLISNIELVFNNAALAAKIAICYSKK
ncbi:MAG: pseudouridine-5'-phosphate glycosidase [Saprospiraceae bacterium]|nr:pseudouridine-5'-phosphate glycosidase [Saprospiraceae bacterium]